MLVDKVFYRLLIIEQELCNNFFHQFDAMRLSWQRIEQLLKDSLDGLPQELVLLVKLNKTARE